MSIRRNWPLILLSFLMALAVGTLLGSLTQTQFNLLALQNLGVHIPLGVRVQTSAQDIANFSPLYAALFGVSLLFSQAAALGLGKGLPARLQAPVCALAAAAGLWLAFLIANHQAPMPTLIAATRTGGGLAAMLASAALAGWLFGRLVRRWERAPGSSSRPHLHRALPAAAVMLLAAPWFTADSQAQPAPAPAYRVETVAEGLEHPWSIAFLPGGEALVTERAGRLRLINAKGQLHPKPIPGVPEVLYSGQAGLKDILLAKNFEQSGLLYLSYACGSFAANHTCVARARLQAHQLLEVEEIFRAQPAKYSDAHFGGRMAWLADGTLILTLGDGFDNREQAQTTRNHIGTIVRLRADGSAPPDNPFIGQASAKPEIYSFGHRNVQGLVYDRANNQLIAHEHGPRGGDEVNIIRPGQNYGWPVVTYGLDYTGARVTPFQERDGMTPPRLQWTPSIAPSGMTLYQGSLFPQWQGSLLVGALAAKRVHRLSLNGGQIKDEETLFAELGQRIRDVRTAPDGAVYLLTDYPQGRVLRVVPR